MKKILYSLTLAVFVVFTSCEGESTGDVSRITFYADIQLKGESVIAITQGATFTDPGVTAISNGESVEVIISGTVDTNTPGVYKINYENINDDGFSASADRTVVVLSSTPSIYNLSGNWKRNSSPATIVQISDREYTHSNAGGVTGDNELKVTFYNIDDTALYIPYQKNVSVSGLSVESVLGSGVIKSANEINWVLNASGFYGSLLRVFTRV